ncbi:MAG: glycosyltransferase [Candidatus Melainabacteria bacterium]|nr:MAG: glycosyltransferase [Candidatus Melainabacteria bacterium]
MKGRILFCLTSNTISGANRVLLELAERASTMGYKCVIHFWNPVANQNWYQEKIRSPEATSHNALPVLSEEAEIQKAVASDFDFVLFSNAFLLPLALPAIKDARPLLICQGYEGYCHANSFKDTFKSNETMAKLYQLPIDKIAISESVQRILSTTLATDSYLVPPAVDKTVFVPMPEREFTASPKRILAVGNYLWPLKGMADLREALQSLSSQLPIELVLVTQQKKGREFFDNCSFPVQYHYQPPQQELAAIYASCDAYCCASWYEGFGLPCLEAFSVGLPVVCTANQGVSDFGLDEVNLLIATPNDSRSIENQLKRILTDKNLIQKLRLNGRKTLEQYNWDLTMKAFEQCLDRCKQKQPVPISEDVLQTLNIELEESGLYTPLARHKQLTLLSERLEETLKNLKTTAQDSNAINSLRDIRDLLVPELSNKNSELYQQFKARYDLCQMLLSCTDHPNFTNIVQSLSRQQ